ncbi:hypothetical protein HMPREF9598_01367 [Cutibacterium acnes HL050PA1]|nr:hypothetical protein HMPREF9612_02337 [Cutibacterium acnes HL063PA2]EFS81944.1 hypothetical protein HMPREF9598_01367 [Cutibacterium acnes HL050PA1]EGE72116.1 hypothetical protein HMPREF9344_02343 [Cutibacterium acnes HL097PA1]
MRTANLRDGTLTIATRDKASGRVENRRMRPSRPRTSTRLVVGAPTR